MSEQVVWALRYAERDLPLLPLHTPRNGRCSCGDPDCSKVGKHARIKDWRNKATTDPDQIRRWWGRWPDANIGMLTGERSGLSVLDIDVDVPLNGFRPPSGPVVQSGGGGVHRYYRHREGVKNKQDPGEPHVRGEGGYVVLPPSLHASGKRYRWKRAFATPLVAFPRIPATNGSRPGKTAETRGKQAFEPLFEGRTEKERHDAGLDLAVIIRACGGDTALVRAGLIALNKSFKPPYVGDKLKDFLRIASGSTDWRVAHEARVLEKTEDLRIIEQARRNLAAEKAGPEFELPAIGRTLADALAEPREPTHYTIDRLHKHGTNTLLVAQYKVGKTTLFGNLIRALADETPFLGEFDVEPLDGKIALFNYELTADMLLEWLENMRISNTERIAEPLNMRGRSLRLWEPEGRKRVVDWLGGNEAKFWFVDPTARAWRGIVEREGDNIQIDAFLDALDEIKEESGCPNLALSTHMGREKFEDDAERARGGTRLEDWMDNGWYMGRDGSRQDAARWFRAMVRGGEGVDAIDLTYEPARMRYMASGKTREERRESDEEGKILEALVGSEPLNAKQLCERGVDKNNLPRLRESLVRAGLIRTWKEGQPTLHELTDAGREKMTNHTVFYVESDEEAHDS